MRCIFLFKGYGITQDKLTKLFDKAVPADFEAIVNQHYKEVSTRMGDQVLPSELFINELASYYIEGEMPDKAYAALNLNIKNYPESFNVYDSMGNYYQSKSNKLKAIEYFKKALAINENKDTRISFLSFK
jgi:tetratricopeptide (TPR) repeat protein